MSAEAKPVPPLRDYLGDGVYGYEDLNGMGIKLTTEDGVEATNTIYLEWEVIDALKRFVERIVAARKERGT